MMRIPMIVLSSVGVVAAKVGGSCSQEEIALWQGNHDFAAAMEKYARRGMGRGSYVASHLVDRYRPHLSEECANCHGGVITCTSKSCWWPCMSSSISASCLLCSKTNCQKAYMDCIGTNDEQALPPKPTQEPSTTTTVPTTTIRPRRLDEATEPPVQTMTSTLPTLLPLDIELWETVDNSDEQ